MELKDFQELSKRTLPHDTTFKEDLSNMCLGIHGEGGEVVDIIKKYLYQGHDLNMDHIKEELGDMMFYIVNLANLINIDMEEVLQLNFEKLCKRYPNGFKIEDSINR